MKDFLDKLGTPKEIAEAMTALSGEKCSLQSVYQWPYENTIPRRWRPFVAKLAAAKGFSAENVPDELKIFIGDQKKIETAQPKRKSKGSPASLKKSCGGLRATNEVAP